MSVSYSLAKTLRASAKGWGSPITSMMKAAPVKASLIACRGPRRRAMPILGERRVTLAVPRSAGASRIWCFPRCYVPIDGGSSIEHALLGFVPGRHCARGLCLRVHTTRIESPAQYIGDTVVVQRLLSARVRQALVQ